MAIEYGQPGDDGAMDDGSFAAMLEETFGDGELSEGSVVNGTVIMIEGDSVLIYVGLKSEGRIPLRELGVADGEAGVKAGDIIDVFLERMEDKQGEAVLSREKARREEAWAELGHSTLLADTPWPQADQGLVVDDTITIAVQVNGKTRGTIDLPRDCPKDEAEKAALALPAVERQLDGKAPRKVIVVQNRIVNVVA